jgi:hypothetical protein
VFGIRLPRALTAAFVNQALKASEGVAGLSAAMRGLIAARTAVMTALAAIDADMRRMTRASAACRRLMTVPGVGQLTALAFVAAIDDPSRIRRSRDIGAYLGVISGSPQVSKINESRIERGIQPLKLRLFGLVIHFMDSKKVDLNLLVALDALLAERNVTRGLSQPALSVSLRGCAMYSATRCFCRRSAA